MNTYGYHDEDDVPELPALTKDGLSGLPGTFLTCEAHPWLEFSANARDYFWMDGDDSFPCPECDADMVEARHNCTLEVVA